MREPVGSVWVTGQQPSRTQRRDRYLPESMKHPGKMLPAIAAQVIATYTEPGELVVDPMCGIGTTLVEAIHQGRHAAGIEYEGQWAKRAAENVAHARWNGAPGAAQVVIGDSRNASRLLPGLAGTAALMLTSPPYGSYTHGHIRSTRDTGEPGIRKWNHHYSCDRANLAHQRLPVLLEGFAQILAAATTLLRPGGVVAITVRPYRVRGELVDLPGRVLRVAEQIGLVFTDRIVCLLCGIDDGRVINRASFFQLHEARKAWERGVPIHALAHEDLLIFHKPLTESADPGRSDDRGHR
ncbi:MULTISPECIES: TRM11 family SAM-dependent methyltransferase [Microbispora]|uniref:Methyltransferase n=3 Tax=Microbispora TaxID=2005 RepID=A0ABY3LSN4_9ACTN|nr:MULTISPECIES: DNA methyltransferase [Microbispora]KAA9375988.1 site-specific DNA-methyltransferase [Microbispora cellulosiformans]TLP57878.1 site-specific DNA-methyltransferase [Microbispora fusca]TYB52346.1 site-specific DNA-methyltransferase [Microbispora tritici]